MTLPTKEQFSGCLIGQCLGDALGFPVEGFPQELAEPYVQRLRIPGASDFLLGRADFKFGQYTDDSQLARELLQSYASVRRFDPQDYAARIAAIFREDRIVGRGLATDGAARRLAQGVHWEEAGAAPSNAGNGSAMRAGPVGLLFAGDWERLTQVAHDQGRITHQDRRCSAGAVAVAGAVALAVRPGTIEVPQLVAELSEQVRKFDDSFADDVVRLREWVLLPPEDAVKIISQCGSPEFSDGWQWISPFVVPSVLWSLYSFLRTPENYWETVCTAISCGGDVDTTAAMAGAISGAHVGLDALPADFARHVTDRGTWGFSELVSLAHQCHDISHRTM